MLLLREEGSGILRWALAGFVKLQAEFAERGDFALTDAQRGRVDSLLAESDSLRLFVKERMARHEYGDVTTSEIQQAYAEFCADKGWNALPITVVERTLPDIMLDVFHVTKCALHRARRQEVEPGLAARCSCWRRPSWTWEAANESGHCQTGEGARAGRRHRPGPVPGLRRRRRRPEGRAPADLP